MVAAPRVLTPTSKSARRHSWISSQAWAILLLGWDVLGDASFGSNGCHAENFTRRQRQSRNAQCADASLAELELVRRPARLDLLPDIALIELSSASGLSGPVDGMSTLANVRMAREIAIEAFFNGLQLTPALGRFHIMEEITRTTGIESQREVYREFYDQQWGAEFTFSLQNTKVWDSGVDLIRNWQAASQARSWPSLMVNMVEASLRKNFEEVTPLSTKKIRFIRDRLAGHLKSSGETLRPAFYRKLEDALVDLDRHADHSMESARDQVISEMDDVWDHLVPLRMFHNMIWSSEITAYASLYYNYEWFMKECVRRARNLEDYEFHSPDLGKVFTEGLGYKCTNEPEIQIAKYTRHALIHNGGHLTAKLKSLPHRHRTEDGELQIAATETTRLFHTLKDKAMLLAKAAKNVESLQLHLSESPPPDAG